MVLHCMTLLFVSGVNRQTIHLTVQSPPSNRISLKFRDIVQQLWYAAMLSTESQELNRPRFSQHCTVYSRFYFYLHNLSC